MQHTQTQQDKKLKYLSLLSENEANIFSNLLEKIEEELLLAKIKPEIREKIERHLSKYPLRLIYVLAENSPTIHSLCEGRDYLISAWGQMLRQLGYPPHAIKSLDKKKTITSFATLKGAFLLSELLKNPDLNNHHSLDLLNRTCELGLYQALIMRLNHYIEKLKLCVKNNEGIESFELYLQQIFKDCKKISNYYWTPGSFNAAMILFDVANFLFSDPGFKIVNERFLMFSNSYQFSWLTKYDDKQAPLPVLILEKALESLYYSHLIRQFDMSISLGEILQDEDESHAKMIAELGDPKGMQRIVTSKLQSLAVPQVESFCDAAYKHSLTPIKDHYDVSLPPDLAHFLSPLQL